MTPSGRCAHGRTKEAVEFSAKRHKRWSYTPGGAPTTIHTRKESKRAPSYRDVSTVGNVNRVCVTERRRIIIGGSRKR